MTKQEQQARLEELLKQLSQEQVEMLCKWWENKLTEVKAKELEK